MIATLALAALSLSPAQFGSAARPPEAETRVLVYTRTTGFRHSSIKAGVEAMRKLAHDKKFAIEHTEDPAQFSPDNLKRFDVVVFLNTTGDVLDDSGQEALQKFLRGGKGFVGIHSATDTEYDWPWYGQMIGAYFASHPAIQAADVHVLDRSHPSTKMLPERWRRTDEWYDFRARPSDKVRILAVVDESTYQGGKMGKDHPVMWCQEFEGGRVWYTAMGHTDETYSEPLFLESLHQGILWAARR
ncbi:MAG TPA: ThuA domain-containing protein [Fimbriimonadaceae bacterium]|nr:ThuA domain-containing protein [Fimbriimonadaceae bacterium]